MKSSMLWKIYKKITTSQNQLEAERYGALNVDDYGVEVVQGVWMLRGYQKEKFYFDKLNGMWIKSVGEHRETGQIFASVDNRYFKNPIFFCRFHVPNH